MSNNMGTDPDIEIAALRKKVATRHVNLMESGPGTPWEDRGSAGAVGAFFKTAFAAMGAPRRLFWQIRRPDTVSDTRALAIVYGVFWGIAWAVNDYLRYRWANEEFDFYVHGYTMIIHFVLGVLATWLLTKFTAAMMFKLISAGAGQNKAQDVLVFNVLAYGLGPSILALVPFRIGPGVALVWIVATWMIGAASRLGLKTGNAIVCVLMSAGLIIGGSAGVYALVVYIGKYLEILA